jgi:hypothetical protein
MDTNSIESLDNIRPEENQIISQDITPIEVFGKNYYIVSSPVDKIGVYEVKGKTNYEISDCFFYINRVIEKEIITNVDTIYKMEFEVTTYTKGIGIQKLPLVPNHFYYDKKLFHTYLLYNRPIFLPKEKFGILHQISAKLSRNPQIETEIIDLSTPPKPFPEWLQVSKHIETFFICRDEDERLGYYQMSLTGQIVKICDFIINIDLEIEFHRGSEIYSIYEGHIKTNSGTTIKFSNLHSDSIYDYKRFIKFLIKAFKDYYMPTLFLNKDRIQDIYSAFCLFFDSTPWEKVKSIIYGYNSELNSFACKNMLINPVDISNEKHSLINEEYWQPNNSSLLTVCSEDLINIKKEIIGLLIQDWKPSGVMMPILAYSLLPLTFPFLDKLGLAKRKPFMLIKGTSGHGKTETAKWMMRFYSDYDQVMSITSTRSSLEQIYTKLKDTLFLIDDLKEENFTSKADFNQFIAMLQNYGDGTIRNKMSGKDILSTPDYISAFLLITAENTLINSPSTIGRGLIVDIEKTEHNPELVSKLERLSKMFRGFTPYFIQFLLNDFIKDSENLNDEEKKGLHLIDYSKLKSIAVEGYNYGRNLLENTLRKNPGLNQNSARIIYSCSLLYASWFILAKFLFLESTEDEFIAIMKRFDNVMENLFIENLSRVNTKTAYIKFTDALNELLEDKKYKLIPYELANALGEADSTLGIYSKINNQVKVCIKMKKAYKIIDRHLQLEGGIGVSYESLLDQLAMSEFIKVNGSGIVSFPNQYKARGVEWISKLNFDFPNDNGKTSETSVTFVTTKEDDLNFEVQTEVQLK